MLWLAKTPVGTTGGGGEGNEMGLFEGVIRECDQGCVRCPFTGAVPSSYSSPVAIQN